MPRQCSQYWQLGAAVTAAAVRRSCAEQMMSAHAPEAVCPAAQQLVQGMMPSCMPGQQSSWTSSMSRAWQAGAISTSYVRLSTGVL
jgi:hypothetical protein